MPISYDPIQAPTRMGALAELRTPVDMLVSAGRWLVLSKKPAPEPRTVLLVPGFGATERSMALIGRHLERVGHRVHDWGLGRNHGKVPALLEALEKRVEELAARAGEPIVAVGWSLGGYLARESARDRPDRFRKVITLGSPVIGGPKFTVTARWYRERGFDVDQIERIVAERFATPLQVPVVAVYSKRDGVVAWEACIDRWSPDVRHVEISATHVGLGISPRAISVVADEVASA